MIEDLNVPITIIFFESFCKPEFNSGLLPVTASISFCKRVADLFTNQSSFASIQIEYEKGKELTSFLSDIKFCEKRFKEMRNKSIDNNCFFIGRIKFF